MKHKHDSTLNVRKSVVLIALVAIACSILTVFLVYITTYSAPSDNLFPFNGICSGANIGPRTVDVQAGLPLRSHASIEVNNLCVSLPDTFEITDFMNSAQLYINLVFWFAAWLIIVGMFARIMRALSSSNKPIK